MAPFDNPDVRNALKYSIDRDEIAEEGLPWPCAPSATTIRSRRRSSSPSNPEPNHNYDPDKAKSLPQEGGPRDPEGRPLGRRRGLRRRHRRRRPLIKEMRPRRRASTSTSSASRRRLLGQCLAEEAVRAPPIGAAARPATGCSPPPMPQTPPWNDTFWKNPRFNELLARGPRRDRRRQARGDVCRDAAARA